MLKIILLLSTLVLCFSCLPEPTVVKKVTDSGTLPPGDDDGGGDDGGGDTGDVYGKIPFFVFQNIIAHGGNSSKVIWSSESSVNPKIDDQNIFRTDATLKFRIIAKPSPGKGVDSMGVECKYYAMNYSRLRLKLGVRAQYSSQYSSIQEFRELELYKPSAPISFTPPVTESHFVVDILGPEWDWYEVNYPGRGYPEWVPVFDNDCIEFEIQMVTDATYDFSDPVAY